VRILITGASGQLGRELSQQLRGGAHEVIAVGRAECDIRDPAAADVAVATYQPDAVVNCAAWTAVDAAETNREAVYAVNAAGAANLATACRRNGTLLCHMSTDFVFDGAREMPIDESVEPHPINVYGASKLEGENAVREMLPHSHLIVRTSWLYGQRGPNFVLTMLRLARERGRLRVVDDQTGSPTWTGDLAPAILRLLESDAQGTFHLSNSGATTWRGFAVAIMQDAALDVPVDAITSAEYPTPARRPPYSVLDNRRWRERGSAPLPQWRDGLRAYLSAGVRDAAAGQQTTV